MEEGRKRREKTKKRNKKERDKVQSWFRVCVILFWHQEFHVKGTSRLSRSRLSNNFYV